VIFLARLTDHDVRDAEHALRAEIALLVGRYTRRIMEQGKAIIQTDLEAAGRSEEAVDGTAIGRAAAERAALEYFGGLAGSTPHAVIEGGTHSALAD
jgi:phage gpG-like protein